MEKLSEETIKETIKSGDQAIGRPLTPDDFLIIVALCTELLELREEIARLREALEAWQSAVVIDVLMEGPRYQGVNGSRGREAWAKARAVLGIE